MVINDRCAWKQHTRGRIKTLRSPFSNAKSGTLVLVLTGLILAGLVLATGLIAITTLLLTGTSIKDSARPPVNASSYDRPLKANPDEPSIGSGGPRISVGKSDVTVWVNTNSGVYHCPNTRWYGNTKSGKFMTQREAQAKGYRPAYVGVCG